MNWVTILVLVVWGLAAFWGFRTGLIRMVVPLVVILLGLVVILLGLVLATRIAEPVGNIFAFVSDNENIQTIIALIAILAVLFIAGAWLSSLLSAAIGVVPFAGLGNHAAGAGIGILIGFVILSTVLTGLQRFPVGNFREDISDSKLGTFLADNFDVVTRGVKLIPGDWDQRARDFSDGIQGRADDFKEDIEDFRPESLPNGPG